MRDDARLLRTQLISSAAWTGAGAAILCAVLGIVAVAVVWLPVSGEGGKAHSAIAAGLLTYLASLHGGITVDGTHATWLPLGLTLIVAAIAWRVGGQLASAVADERDVRVLARTGAVQAAAFATVSLVLVPFARLGSSGASYVGVGFAAVILFALTGGVAYVRGTALCEAWFGQVPATVWVSVRAAVSGLLVLAAGAALLVGGSLLFHAGTVTTLSRQVGGGWGSVPILLLGILAAPNAVIGGASYLAGPGVHVGAAHATALSTAHGTLPAFPLLGAMPSGDGASPLVWTLAVVVWLGAGFAAAAVIVRRCTDALPDRLLVAVLAAAAAGLLALLAGWVTGGGIGGGNLASIGVPAGWFALLVAGELLAASALGLVLATVGSGVVAGLRSVGGQVVEALPFRLRAASTDEAGQDDADRLVG